MFYILIIYWTYMFFIPWETSAQVPLRIFTLAARYLWFVCHHGFFPMVLSLDPKSNLVCFFLLKTVLFKCKIARDDLLSNFHYRTRVTVFDPSEIKGRNQKKLGLKAFVWRRITGGHHAGWSFHSPSTCLRPVKDQTWGQNTMFSAQKSPSRCKMTKYLSWRTQWSVFELKERVFARKRHNGIGI